MDASGSILARLGREDGDGVITSTINPGSIAPSDEVPDRFWLPDLPNAFRFFWSVHRALGKRYYRKANARGLFTNYGN